MTNESLNQETLARIKTELLEKKTQIEAELKEIESDGEVKFPDYGDKADENAQEMETYTTNLATDQILESTLRDINDALERIETGEYGTCKYCHEPIDIKRLEVRPVASACIKCKTKLQNQ